MAKGRVQKICTILCTNFVWELMLFYQSHLMSFIRVSPLRSFELISHVFLTGPPVVPESCQRTDGIDAWLEGKEEEKVKRMEREERKREKQDILNKVTEERIARNAERQKEIELRNLKKLIKEDSILNQDMIEEKEVIIKDLNTLIDNKGSLNPSCVDCQDCSKGSLPGCQCQCRACEQVKLV